MSALQSLVSNPIFSESFGFRPSLSSPRVDWKENKEAHIFKFDLPGLTKEDVKLQVHDSSVLHISAERKAEDQECKENNVKWHCKERVGGNVSFSREFRLPENALVDHIKASMSEGVLVVTVPNKKKKHKKHAVEIAGEEESASGFDHKGLGRFVCCKA